MKKRPEEEKADESNEDERDEASDSESESDSDPGSDDDDDDADDDDDDDADDDESAGAAGRSRKVAPARDARPAAQEPQGGGTSSTLWMAAGVALLVGGGAGWFGHNAYAKNAGSAIDAAPLSSADLAAGPCKAWEKQICDSTGPVSATCRQVQGASEILSPNACEAALKDVPDTLAKVAKEREKCTSLVTKLCADLGKETNTCKMVESRTPTFPPKRCEDMLGQYDKVLEELKKIEAQGGMAGPPGGMPPGGMPPGAMPPGGMRPGGMPKGMPPGHPPAGPGAPVGPAPGAPDPHGH